MPDDSLDLTTLEYKELYNEDPWNDGPRCEYCGKMNCVSEDCYEEALASLEDNDEETERMIEELQIKINTYYPPKLGE